MLLLLLCAVQPHRIAQRPGADNPDSSLPLQALHGLGGHAQLCGNPLIGDGFLLQKLLQEALLCRLLFPPALSQQEDDLLPAQYPLQCSVLQPLYGAFGRQHYFQGLDHGGAVVFPDPAGQGDHPVFHTYAAPDNALNFFDPGRVVLADFSDAYHIAFQKLIAVSKRNRDAGPCLQLTFKSLGDAVLERSVQFFMGNVYDDICVVFSRLFHSVPFLPPGFYFRARHASPCSPVSFRYAPGPRPAVPL